MLLETIRLQDGQLVYLSYHQARLDRTQLVLFGHSGAIDLTSAIIVPTDKTRGCFKVRVSYTTQIESVEILPYVVRPVAALQLVEIPDLSYDYKYADRTALVELFNRRTYGDDILMIREGLLTDTSYANVALFDGYRWYTPRQPLLPGTARARYLEEEFITISDIHWRDLPDFQELRLINAMMTWEEGPGLSTGSVKW